MDVLVKSVKTCEQSQLNSVIREKGFSLPFDGNSSNMNWIFLLMAVKQWDKNKLHMQINNL